MNIWFNNIFFLLIRLRFYLSISLICCICPDVFIALIHLFILYVQPPLSLHHHKPNDVFFLLCRITLEIIHHAFIFSDFLMIYQRIRFSFPVPKADYLLLQHKIKYMLTLLSKMYCFIFFYLHNLFFYLIIFNYFIVVQLHLSAFSPHPSIHPSQTHTPPLHPPSPLVLFVCLFV